MKVQTFLAIGGPLDGHQVTEDYAGDEYNRFNSSRGETYKMTNNGYGCTYERDAKGKKIIERPKCVLIHDSIFEGK